jgi:hypothetical protein
LGRLLGDRGRPYRVGLVRDRVRDVPVRGVPPVRRIRQEVRVVGPGVEVVPALQGLGRAGASRPAGGDQVGRREEVSHRMIKGSTKMGEIMETSEAWRTHEPVWSQHNGEGSDEHDLLYCGGCGAKPGDGDYGPYWFGTHLTELDAPDYMQTYWNTWTQVEAPTGRIDRDAVARELFDFTFVMEQVSTVYSELADLSKPNYHASAILGVIHDRQEEHYREHYAERLCDRADEVDNADIRAELLRLAEEWSPGSWAEYQHGREMVARLQAEKAA